MIKVEFPECDVIVYPEYRTVETWFPDGKVAIGTRDGKIGNQDYAEYLGYATAWQALVEHELLHTWISIRLDKPYSPTLWAVAHGYTKECAPYEERLLEEALVLSCQRFLRTGHIANVLGMVHQPFVALAEWKRFLEERPELNAQVVA